jgi:WD40 repeat protein
MPETLSEESPGGDEVTASAPASPESPQAAGAVDKRSRKVYVLWGVALALLVTLTLFSWLVVVPTWQTHRVVAASAPSSGCTDGRTEIRSLGGQNSARTRLLGYLRMPQWLVSPKNRDKATHLLGRALVGDDDDVFLVLVSPDRRKAFVSNDSGKATIWDLGSGRPISVLSVSGRYEAPKEVAWSPGSRCIGTTSGFYLGSYTRGATIWEVETGTAKLQLDGDNGVGTILYSSDGKYIFTGGSNFDVRASYDQAIARALIWDTSTGKSTARLQIKTLKELDSVSEVIFSADGSTVHLFTKKGTRTFSCRTGKESP